LAAELFASPLYSSDFARLVALEGMLAARVAAFSWLTAFAKSKDDGALTTGAVLVPAEGSGTGSEGPVEVPDFATIYDRHFAFVWRLAANCRVPQSHLDDVVQEIFLVIHRKLPGFEGRSSLRTWIASISRYTAKEFLRRKRHQMLGTEVDPDASASTSMTPAEQLEAVAAAQLLDQFLDELPEEQREAFILAEVEQMTAEEIAVVLESNSNTVRSRLRSARQGVQASLARHRAQERWRDR
jgi:RNA polymerase sigma-70 factor, ECF subfamily